MQFDVFGMCNALFDIQAEVSDAVLADVGLAKGTMALLKEREQRDIVPRVYEHIVHTEAGGSGANTMIGLAQMGARTCFTSCIGDDEHGRMYRNGLLAKSVQPNLGQGAGVTGISLILVTPDAERTMGTFLGRSRELRCDDVRADDLRASRYLYVTGYLWDTETQKEAVLFAMQEANRAGVKVALSLSDPFCVARHKDDFLRLLRDHVDVLFGNAIEAQELTDTQNPHDAAHQLSEYADVVAITRGAQGALLRTRNEMVEILAYPVQAVDSTGAGDMFAAGLLYGLSRNLPLKRAGRIAAYASAQVVAKLGPRLEQLDTSRIARLASGEETF